MEIVSRSLGIVVAVQNADCLRCLEGPSAKDVPQGLIFIDQALHSHFIMHFRSKDFGTLVDDVA